MSCIINMPHALYIIMNQMRYVTIYYILYTTCYMLHVIPYMFICHGKLHNIYYTLHITWCALLHVVYYYPMCIMFHVSRVMCFVFVMCYVMHNIAIIYFMVHDISYIIRMLYVMHAYITYPFYYHNLYITHCTLYI